MEEAHHQYGGGYAVWTCHIIDIEESVQYWTTKTAQRVVVFIWWRLYLSGKMIFYRQSYCNPGFILLWLNPDVRLRSLQDATMITCGSFDSSSVIL